jgi:elongation factor Ts
VAISIEMIKQLREATGAGVLDVKKALESTGGDFEQAAALLREKGLAKAAKRADRETTEGRVEAREQDGKVGLLVEVNCETDFVGSNEGFVAFSESIAEHFFAVAQEGQPLDEVMAVPLFSDASTTPTELLQHQISSTGENMAVRRFVRFELSDGPGLVEVYAHPGNRVAVMLEVHSETPQRASTEEFSSLVHDLALHVAASAPLYVTRDQIPAEKLEAEKEAYRKQAWDEGKPEAIVERIVEGRLRKFYETTVLLEQPFVKDDEVKVGQLLEQHAAAWGEKIAIRRLARYELGEPLE